MARQYRGKAPRKNDIRYAKRLGMCPICGCILTERSISVGNGESVCPECLDEYKRRQDPNEVRICAECGEPTTTPYAILPSGEVVCCEGCFDDYEQRNDFVHDADYER